MKTFISVAQMKLAFLTAGQQVETSGYYAPGDGGQARYLVKANESVDNLGNHDLAGTTVAILQDNGSLNVWQFGAVHDGVTNDTAAFDAAEIALNPALVLVPVASYEISGTVTGSFYSFGVVTILTGNVNAIFNINAAASTILQGLVELATQAEVDAGIDAVRVVTPATLAAISDTFSATPTGVTSPSGTIAYSIQRNLCTLRVTVLVGGNSNANTFTFSGLPAVCTPASQISLISHIADTGVTNLFPALATVKTDGTVVFSIDSPFSTTGFTNDSNVKGLPVAWTITYPLS